MRPDSYPVATVFMCFGGERRLGLRLRPDSYPVAVDEDWWLGWLGLRRARGLIESDEGKIASVFIFPSSLSMRPCERLNLTPNGEERSLVTLPW